MSVQRIRHPQKLGDHLGAPDEHEVSFVALFDGWIEDLERLHASLATHLGSRDWELVAVDNPVDAEASERIAALPRIVHAPLRDQMGWSAGRNLGVRLATGTIVAVVDSSVELTGDVVACLQDHLRNPEVGLVGRWGVSTSDGYAFAESSGPDVDGVEAYLMAFRRGDVPRVGLFDPKFKWYRNADIDHSFRVRDAGLRTVVDPDLPVRRHEHRLWEATPEAERDERSRKNFFRFRDHWGERKDLFVELN
ncbi:MAG: glycosyltransferase family 2 protein [Actinomycetota bacterium]